MLMKSILPIIQFNKCESEYKSEYKQKDINSCAWFILLYGKEKHSIIPIDHYIRLAHMFYVVTVYTAGLS